MELFYSTTKKNLKNRKLYWPRGRVIGGSSSLNAMIYHRGVKTDYDGWEKLGNKGWSYEEVLQEFKKSENNLRKGNEEFDKYHGHEGELVVTNLEEHEASSYILKGMLNEDPENIKLNTDFNNGENPFGAGVTQCHMKKGQRFSAADAFLSEKVLERKNLRVILNSHVKKLIFDEKNQEVKGVLVDVKDKGEFSLFSTKETILSAGAINSPQILLLSGIGPKDELERHNIKVVKELKGVGKNLQDHISFSVAFNSTIPTLATQETLPNILKWATQGNGPLQSNIGEILWFGKTKYAEKDNTKVGNVDVEIIGAPVLFLNHGFAKVPYDVISLVGVALRPKSFGEIKLNSSDPYEKPLIDPKYFSNEDDLNVLVEAFKKMRKIFKTKPLSDVVKAEMFPGLNVVPEDDNDEKIKEFLRLNVETLYHPSSTCKMGNDDNSVVDERLRVHGIKRLRVADASIMPFLVSGHTNSASIMIGEKCATMIKEDNKN